MLKDAWYEPVIDRFYEKLVNEDGATKVFSSMEDAERVRAGISSGNVLSMDYLLQTIVSKK